MRPIAMRCLHRGMRVTNTFHSGAQALPREYVLPPAGVNGKMSHCCAMCTDSRHRLHFVHYDSRVHTAIWLVLSPELTVRGRPPGDPRFAAWCPLDHHRYGKRTYRWAHIFSRAPANTSLADPRPSLRYGIGDAVNSKIDGVVRAPNKIGFARRHTKIASACCGS